MGKLDTTQIDQLLKEPIISVITTMRPDGTPHMTPVWHLVRGDKIIAGVEERSVKASNVRNNPNVALCVVANESPQRWALVNGTAQLTHDQVTEVVTEVSMHYVPGEAEGRAYVEKVLRELEFVLIEITPTSVIGFDGVD
ncbi:MAG: TIGR03618 family F420-dependent PPOX class oxidoreductase [SAR202 cluster bacterium]|nr:TIGR03618 family F420-dependent PPOX class oxidoreductase [SAR202 cluster bacterium]MDP6716379.1 TIGR03618 family F420-dependent PPOX class oxidoreductase [SAR202 cluster bacterium]